MVSSYLGPDRLTASLQNEDSNPSDQDHHLARRVSAFRGEFKSFFEHLKHIFLIPLSWFLTLVHFALILVWRILVSARISFQRWLAA